MVVVAWRALLAAVLLLVVLAARSPGRLRLPRREIPFFVLYGLVAAANYAGYFLALRHTTVAVAIVLLYTYPAFTVLAARALFAESIDAPKAAALGLTFAGIALVAPGHNAQVGTSAAGIAFGLGAGLAMAGYGLMGKRATRHLDPWTTALYSFAFAASWLILAAGPRMAQAATYSPGAWLALIYLAAGPTLAAYGLFLWALPRMEVGRASLWTTFEPPLATLMAFAALGETITMRQAAGAALILTGVAILHARRPRA